MEIEDDIESEEDSVPEINPFIKKNEVDPIPHKIIKENSPLQKSLEEKSLVSSH